MKKEFSSWNGYIVHGDVMELNAIIDSIGFINLDNEDVVSVLSADGENWVTTGVANLIAEAFDKAVDGLPYFVNKARNLLIDFRYGNQQPKMAELSKITATLSDASPAIEIKWGITNDESLGDTFKVILVASADL